MRPGMCLILPTMLALASPAGAQDVLSAVRADRWADAQLAAASYADPVAPKLVSFFRMVAPNGAAAREISDFIAQSPDWPSQALLARRRDEALAREPDDTTAAELCTALTPPVVTPFGAAAELRCAEAFSRLGRADDAAAMARSAWLGGLVMPAAETGFMERWGGVITRQDQEARFDALAWTDTVAAARQTLRLDAADRPAAAARLAMRRDDPNAAVLLGILGPGPHTLPGLFLERARWLRRAGLDDEALALWKAEGIESERRAMADHLPAFWDERNLLARRRLRLGDAAGAFWLADDPAQTDLEKIGDAEFLAGFIALRRLNDPPTAIRHFSRLTEISRAALTQSRGHYWLGRAIAAKGDAPGALREYALAAAWPTTYYGQLAIRALGADTPALQSRLADLRDPGWSDQQALDFAGREVTRAAALLIAWGDPHRARSFLLRLEELAPDGANRALVAKLATGFGMADEAVTIARRAGRDGTMLPESGWPMPFDVAELPVPGSMALGIMRQESSFDPGVLSPAGARGLMQLMPGTAQQVGRKLGLNPSLQALTADPALNIQLGTTYLRGLLDQFSATPLAVAAYNAGPSRVADWLAGNGDPRAQGGIDMIDWIELIPFSETRNYVQRVSENIVMYAARRHEGAAISVAQQN